MYKELLLERQGGIAVLTLNRPERLNTLTVELVAALREVLADVRTSETTRALLVTGGERCFCAGADISVLNDLSGPAEVGTFLKELRDLFREVAELPKPVVAAVSGPAVGGGLELVLVCDLCVAGESARFSLPEVNLDLIPGAGGAGRLGGLIGPRRAKELLLTGRTVEADEASNMGLVNSVVPDSEVLPAALEAARELSRKPPAAVAAIKQVARIAERASESVEEEQLEELLETGSYRKRLAEFFESRRVQRDKGSI
jgi:enoyl-CoA hydratase/carnithine racemase